MYIPPYTTCIVIDIDSKLYLKPHFIVLPVYKTKHYNMFVYRSMFTMSMSKSKSRSLREFQRRSVKSRLRTQSERIFNTACEPRCFDEPPSKICELQRRVTALRETHLSVNYRSQKNSTSGMLNYNNNLFKVQISNTVQ